MPYKGTDLDAYYRAGKGKTKKERSRLYHKYKKHNEEDKIFLDNLLKFPFGNNPFMYKNTKRKKKYIRTIQGKKNNILDKIKYVPKQLILDDIRDFRSSKIISNISDQFATIIMKLGRTKNMTNYQMNLLRSTIALITSETINKALEKPLKIIDNIKMFIEVGKIVYKVIIFFDSKLNLYQIDKRKIKKVKLNSNEYKSYLINFPKVNAVQKRNKLLGLLGSEVFVIIDKPIQSNYNGIIYPVNCGYLSKKYAIDNKKSDVFVLGVNKSLKKFKGLVLAIIQRNNDNDYKLVVCPTNLSFTKEEIKEQLLFKEKVLDDEITTRSNNLM